MPYVEDQNGNHILHQDGKKMPYTVTHELTSFIYKYKELIHVDNNGHLNTENRQIVIKDAVNQDHAVSKNQLDQ